MNISTDFPASAEAGSLWILAAQSDHEALLQLQGFLSANRDRAVWLEASDLRRPDTILFQLIAAARRDWSARGLSFRLTGFPDRLASLLPLLGLQPDLIGIEVH
jgi:anti-anti-sigma regulatory factor